MDTLVLVDVQDSHGMMISRQRLSLRHPGDPLVIGRDIACDVVLNDPYVAARHATLSLQDDGHVRIDDLGTLNGLIVRDERVTRAVIEGQAGSVVQVGHSHLHIRVAGEPLAPERRDLESLRSRHRDYTLAVLGALLCLGFAGLAAWTGKPDDPRLAFATYAFPGAAVLFAWTAAWVLLGRAVRSRWQWSVHAATALFAAGVGLWLYWAADVAVFVTGVPRAGTWLLGAAVVTAVAALHCHLLAATRFRRWQAIALAAAVPLAGVLASAWFHEQQADADVNHIGAAAPVYPPAWSRQPGMRPERFFEEAQDLRDRAEVDGAATAPLPTTGP